MFYKVVGNRMHVYDESRRFVCTHTLSECRGTTVQLKEHRHQSTDKWIPIVERMRKKWNCIDFQHFVNGVKKENPRYLVEQFSAIERFLDEQSPDRATVAVVMKICCEKYRYQFSQFKVVYTAVEKGQISGNRFTCSDVQKQDLSVYQKAFEARCTSSREEALV